MIREAIAEYIKARAAKLRGCEHEWKLLSEVNGYYKLNPEHRWIEHHYYCPKCLSHHKISTKDD